VWFWVSVSGCSLTMSRSASGVPLSAAHVADRGMPCHGLLIVGGCPMDVWGF